MTVDFLPFAITGGADVVTQAQWAALLGGGGALVDGFQSGVALSEQCNKAWRQSSVMAAAVANAVADLHGVDVEDDGDMATLIKNVKLAMQYANAPAYATDSGAANAYVIALVPTVAAYTNGMVVTFKATNANSGASTLNAGGGAVSLRNSSGAALASGDITAGQVLSAIYDAGTGFFRLLGLTPGQAQNAHGQCVLAKSGGNLVLSPKNGNKLVINGVSQTVPTAGVSLGTGGLAASTFYYIYAYMNAGVMTLEASATNHATQANTGIEIKNGDATRTLVGMAQTTGATAWLDDPDQRLVRSWFYPGPLPVKKSYAANHTTTSTSYVEISSGDRIFWLSWAGESVDIATSGEIGNGIAGGQEAAFSIGIDSAAPVDTFGRGGNGGFASVLAASCRYLTNSLGEGLHYATILALSQAGGTVTVYGSGAAGASTSIMASIG